VRGHVYFRGDPTLGAVSKTGTRSKLSPLPCELPARSPSPPIVSSCVRHARRRQALLWTVRRSAISATYYPTRGHTLERPILAPRRPPHVVRSARGSSASGVPGGAPTFPSRGRNTEDTSHAISTEAASTTLQEWRVGRLRRHRPDLSDACGTSQVRPPVAPEAVGSAR